MDQSTPSRADKMEAQPPTEVNDELTMRQTPKNKQPSGMHSPDNSAEFTPNVLFKKMVEENQKRNSKVIQKLEIDRRATNRQRDNANSDQPTIKVRFCVCLLALTGLAFSQMSRMVMNVTITSMVDPRLLDTNSEHGSSPIESVEQTTTSTSPITISPDSTQEPEIDFLLPTTSDHVIDTGPPEGQSDGQSDGQPHNEQGEHSQPEEPVTEHNDDTTVAPIETDLENDQSIINAAVFDPSAESDNAANQPVEEQQQQQQQTTESQADNSQISEEHNANGNNELDSHTVAYSDRQTDNEQQHSEHDQQNDEAITEPGHSDHSQHESQQQQVNHDTASNNNDGESQQIQSQFTDAPDASMVTNDAIGPVDTHNDNEHNKRKRRSIEPHGANNINNTDQPIEAPAKPMHDASLDDKFGWTTKERNIVLGGFYSSYFVFMIIGGRMAEIYGSKYIILISVFGSALVNLFTPWMAKTNFYLLVASRVALGAMQSGIFPGCYALFAKWLTLSETSIFAPLIKVSLRLGSMLASCVPGLIIDKSGIGWQNVFYTTGTLCLLWSIPWFLLASSFPEDNRFVSKAELAHIVKKKRKFNGDIEATPMSQITATSGRDEAPKSAEPQKPKQDNSTPWLNIITAGPVIALIVVKLSFNYVVDFMCIQLPSYLKYVHHADQQQTSWIMTPLFAIQVVLVTGVAYLAKEAVRRKPFGLQKTGIRKLFQGTASFGAAFVLFMVTLNNNSLLYVGIAMQILSVLTMFVAGGEVVLPYDLSDEFQATIMGIANSVANLSGVTVTYMTAKILGEQGSSAERWHIIINLIAAISFLGGLTFLLLAKAEHIDFRASKQARKEKKNQLNNGLNSQANTGVSKM